MVGARDVLKVTEQRWEKLYGQEMKRTTLEGEAIKEAINKHLLNESFVSLNELPGLLMGLEGTENVFLLIA